MTSSRDRNPLEIRINPSHPELLTGLEAWLNLGLIDQEQVRQIAKSRLSCQIPEPVVAEPVKPPVDPEPATFPPPSPSTEEKVENFLSRSWNAFREELSVRWLLFLGVFAVLVASGGLAASQWDNFSAIAQYAVLWGYTLAFGGVGAWIARQHRSRLTAGALQTITALLVPINFWAMDALIAWNRPLGWLMIALAATTLTGWVLLQRYQPVPFTVVFLGGSYLHWGWDIANWPTVAVYLGAIASTALIGVFSGKQNSQDEFALSEASLTIYALVILLGRAIIVVGIPLMALDLAIAICGWLLTINREPQESVVSKGMEIIGGSFLLLAWGLALGESFPWQAVVATALALEWVWRRLRQFWQYWDLIAVFGIGLQGWGLLSQLIPPSTRAQLISVLEQGLGLETAPFWVLPSLGLFPYLVIFLGLVDWLYQIEKPQLGQVGEGCSLGLGTILTVAGLGDPSTRSLALLMMTVMLVIVTARRSPTRIGFVYVTHLVAWLAIASSLDWMIPNLAFRDWGILALVAMVGEWAVSTRIGSVTRPWPRQVAYRSGWEFGFLFASLSFVLLANQSAGTPWGGLWLIAPITLTVLTNHWEQQRQNTAAGWAITASLVAQGLTMTSLWTRLIGWSVATGLLAINTRYFPKPAVAMLPVGSALALAASPFWNQLRVPGWLIWGAIALILLWLATDILSRRRQRYALLYARATNYWGMLVCIGLLTVMTGHGMEVMLQGASEILPNWESSWAYAVAASLSTIALGTRYWRAPKQATGYGLIIAIELTALETVYLAGGSQLALAMVNLGLGFLALFASYRLPSRQLTTSLQIAPFCFAVIGVIARLGHFTTYTGLLTLAAAVIGLFVGSRRRDWKVISYIALLGIFLGIQELVIYQFSPGSPAVSVTDLSSLLATVTLALALVYRAFTRILSRQERETALGLSIGELIITAHLHWGTAGILAAIAAFTATETSQTIALMGIINCVILVAYALTQGYQTRNNRPIANTWISAGWLAGELAIAEIIHLTQGNWLAVATTHIILGVIALAVTEGWRRQRNSLSRLASVELLPLFFVSVGTVARYGYSTAETGGIVLVAAIVAFGVGARRENWTVFSHIALVAVSFGCYELLINLMLSGEGSGVAIIEILFEGLTPLATVAAGIAIVERAIAYWAQLRGQPIILGLPLPTLKASAHLHWAGASLLKITDIALATRFEPDPKLNVLGVGISTILAIYAVIQGRDRAVNSDWWVYVGLVQLIGIAVFTRLIWTELAILDPWVAMMACLVGLTILQLPWQHWGWNANPWYRVANALPAVRVLVTADEIAWFNLFIVAGFYGRVAWRQQNIRWSYGSVALSAWGTAQLLDRFQLTDPFWYAALMGLCILYIASVDPALRPRSRRNIRHWLRLFGSGIISLAGVFSHPDIVLAPTLIGLVLVLAGIALQVRAFLLVGTATLLLTGIQQVIAFSQAYSFAKWVIGLVVGIVLIAIAASFESRRERMISTFQNWRSRFREWE